MFHRLMLPRLVAALAIALLGLVVPSVVSAPEAGAATRCAIQERSPGFGDIRFCKAITSRAGSRIDAAISWEYDDPDSRSNRNRMGRVVLKLWDTAPDGVCAHLRTVHTTQHEVKYRPSCGQGTVTGYDLNLNEARWRTGNIRLYLCTSTSKPKKNCTRIWAPDIAQRSPR